MSKNSNSAVGQNSAVKRIKQQNMLTKQRFAIVITAIAVVALVAALITVNYLVGIYKFSDNDGTVYYAKKDSGTYALYNKDGSMCDKTEDGYYQTALGTLVSVDAESGECKIYAYVHTSGTEVRDFDEYVLMFKRLTYDQGSTNDQSKIIKSIEVHNEFGTYTFERDKNMNFVIRGEENTPYDRESFAYLAVACGYTLSTQRLQNPQKLGDGSIDYSEYGLAAERRVRVEKDEQGNDVEVEYDYEPAWYVITSMTGESHKVILGDKTVTGTGYYALYEGRDTIYVLGAGFDGYALSSIEAYITPTIVYPMGTTNYFNVRNFMIYGNIEYEKIYAELAEKYGEINFEKLDEETKKKYNEDYARLFEEHSKKMCDFSYLDAEDRVGTLYAHSPYYNGLDYADGYYLNSNSIEVVISSFANTDFTGVVKLSPTKEQLDEYGLVDPAYIVMFYFATTDSEGNEAFAQNYVQISAKSDGGIYYAYSETHDMIVGINSDCFEFLEWEEIQWYETNYIQNDISYVDKIQIESPEYKVDFVIEDSASKYMTYLQRFGSKIGDTEYTVIKHPDTGRYVLAKKNEIQNEVYRGDYLITPVIYKSGKAEAENYLFSETEEIDFNGDGQKDGFMYYFYNIGYNSEIKGYGLFAQIVVVDYEGNRLAEDTMMWGKIALQTEYFAMNNGYMFFVSKDSQTGAQLESVYGSKGRGKWGEGNLFITSDNESVLINEKTGAWMTLDSYAHGIYFADKDDSRLAQRAVTIPAIYDSNGKLKRYEETYYPTTDKKIHYVEETGKIMAYNKNSGVYEDILQSECTIGVWNTGAYYVLDDGSIVVVNDVTGEWGYASVLSNPLYIADIYANGSLLDYSIPIVTASNRNSEKTAMENFQQFYKALLIASFEGMAELTDEEMAHLAAMDDFANVSPDNPCQLKITVSTTDLKGNSRNVVYRIYRYSERKSYITVELLSEDGESSSSEAYGSFYVLYSFAQKLIQDAEKVVEGIEVVAESKY